MARLRACRVIGNTAYCDGPGCDSHQGPSPALIPFRGWLRVTETDTAHDFCGWECAIRFGAQLPAPETIDLTGEL